MVVDFSVEFSVSACDKTTGTVITSSTFSANEQNITNYIKE